MKKILIPLAVCLVLAVGGVLGVMVCTGLLTADGFTDVTCDGSDPEAVFARSLSRDRLAKLFVDVRSEEWDLEAFVDAPEIPDEFRDLNARLIHVYHDGDVAFRLRGCMDHHLDLRVVGALGGDAAERRIELIYGEFSTSGSELLWTP